MTSRDPVLVAGAGGFIGGHLVAALRRRGYGRIRAVDIKPLDQWRQRFPDVEGRCLDLRLSRSCHEAVEGVSSVFNLAADMGGMGFIERHRAACMLSVLINTHLLMAARDAGVRRYFFASSACVYPADKQTESHVPGLRETDAYPAMPEDGYGWEKLFGERMCRHFAEDFGLETRVARYHNVYGPCCDYGGGRAKAPAALCRKVAQSQLDGTGEIEIWGDGEQTRSFTYVDDCVEGTLKLMSSDMTDPVNIGSDRMLTINQLVDIVEEIAGVKLERRYRPEMPKGVRGRNSENTLVRRRLGWVPSIRLEDGIRRTYAWILKDMTTGLGSRPLGDVTRAACR